ncbi:MAG: threonine ammonia-lyase [Hyphomicrobiales bacterium]|nr:threonine ammonia-lyase [Hyphomicrobiales bacterium]
MPNTPALWPDLAAIEAAADLLKGQIIRTPCLAAPRLSALTGADCVVKFENMQVTGSFKERGAYVKMSRLDGEARKKGVIAMSAGNHAQAVAYHAQRLGIPATIVMPEATPQVKVENTARFGAEVILKGETLAESQAEVERLIAERGLVLVHPYDDPDIVAGQGTIGLEMLADFPDLDCILVPMGGGGLISGVALAAKALKPGIEIVGVEVASYPSFHNAMTGSSLSIGGPTLAEGIAVKHVGKLTLEIAKSLVSGPILVPESAVERAVDAFANHQRSMAEGAGAAGLAALLHEPQRFRGRKVGLILCGGNIDARILASIMVRELERKQRIISFRLTSDDRPGFLGRVATRLGELGANILEVTHRRTFLSVPARGVSLDVTVETRGEPHAAEIFDALAAEGLNPQRIDPDGVVMPWAPEPAAPLMTQAD